MKDLELTPRGTGAMGRGARRTLGGGGPTPIPSLAEQVPAQWEQGNAHPHKQEGITWGRLALPDPPPPCNLA